MRLINFVTKVLFDYIMTKISVSLSTSRFLKNKI